MNQPLLRRLATLSAAALPLVAGCTETTGDTRASAPAAARTPTPAEQACLRDVTRETNSRRLGRASRYPSVPKPFAECSIIAT